MFADLVRVHALLRGELERVQKLAEGVNGGLPPAETGARVKELAASGPLWQLRVGCIHYCQFVHSHHMVEDAALFPVLRRIDPELAPAIDRLEADHKAVSSQLDEVEAAAEAFGADPTADGRDRLAAALTTLAEHLLAHLDLEEDTVEDTMSRMTLYP